MLRNTGDGNELAMPLPMPSKGALLECLDLGTPGLLVTVGCCMMLVVQPSHTVDMNDVTYWQLNRD